MEVGTAAGGEKMVVEPVDESVEVGLILLARIVVVRGGVARHVLPPPPSMSHSPSHTHQRPTPPTKGMSCPATHTTPMRPSHHHSSPRHVLPLRGLRLLDSATATSHTHRLTS